MPRLHETPRGARFFDTTMPRIADELATLNNNLAALIALLRERWGTAGGTPERISEPATRR